MKQLRANFAAVILPMMMVVVGCNHQDPQAQLLVRPVQTVRVGDNPAVKAAPFAGEVRARLETLLAFRVTGKIIDRPVEVGDPVHKGQLLARLDASDYLLGTQTLKAQLKSAQADRDFAKNDLARYRELLQQHIISPPEFDRHDTAYTAAQQRVEALAAQLGQAVNQLAYTELRADRDGAVTALEAEAGQVVSAGQAVVKLARLDDKEILFDIPEQRVGDLKPQQPVSVSLWTTGERRFDARIREIAAAADPVSRTYRVKATLLDGLDSARLGMTATVWLPENVSATLSIPLSAVFTPQNTPEQQRVWLVDEAKNSVNSVPIQLGAALADERVAVTGLAPGQLIVSAGVQRLAEGQLVRLPDADLKANGGRHL
ncbi:MAG: efflux RND transporter periplasmic adaptor subunit [Methylovulum sp.]|nr:efflux RND transporter periplasmic adaptor subunit [Methylovulum sp.]